MSPAISIVIPAYNVQNNICHTLKSLSNQVDSDFEVIVINDGSTDNTKREVDCFLKNSEHIKYRLINKENGGVSSARNLGIAEAKGKYICFLDGDDYISNDMVCTVKYLIEDGNPDIIAWGYNIVNENKETTIEYFDVYDSDLSKMTGKEALVNILNKDKRLWICTGSAAYRKDLLINNNILYTEGCFNGEDQEFAFKALSKAKEVAFINKVLFFYFQRDGSISNSYSLKRFDVIKALDRTATYLKKNADNDMGLLIDYLENNHTIENYLGNLDSCLRYQLKKSGMSTSKAIENLLADIDNNFPGMNENIKNRIEAITNVGLLTNFKYKMFLFNPLFYANLIGIQDKLRRTKKLLNKCLLRVGSD